MIFSISGLLARISHGQFPRISPTAACPPDQDRNSPAMGEFLVVRRYDERNHNTQGVHHASKSDSLIWGLILIVAGGLFMARNLDYEIDLTPMFWMGVCAVFSAAVFYPLLRGRPQAVGTADASLPVRGHRRHHWFIRSRRTKARSSPRHCLLALPSRSSSPSLLIERRTPGR